MNIYPYIHMVYRKIIHVPLRLLAEESVYYVLYICILRFAYVHECIYIYI